MANKKGAPLRALMWKNMRLRRKNLVACIFEILLPALGLFLLYLLQVLEKETVNPNCYLKAKAMPSASGMLSLQTYLCAATNTCENETDASSESFSSSILTTIGEALKSSLNIKSKRSDKRRRTIGDKLYLNKWTKDFHVFDSLIEAIENEDRKWDLLYKLLRSNIYSETSEIERRNIKKLQRMKKSIHQTGVLNSFFQVLAEVSGDSVGELNFFNNFFCGPDMERIEKQLIIATEEENKGFSVKGYVKDDEMSDFCNSMLKFLEKNYGQSIMAVLKPLLFGKVVYTPDAPVINRVMKGLSDSFKKMKDVLDSLKVVVRMWTELKAWKLDEVIDKYRNEDIFLREAVKTKTGRAIVKRFYNETYGESEEESLKGRINGFQKLLKEAKDKYKTYLLETDQKSKVLNLVSVMECLDFDKVVAKSSEGAALAKAKKFLEKQRLWGYVVFTNVPSGAETLPPSVTYKIRIAVDRAPNTKYTKNAVNATKAKTKPNSDLKEILGGTVHLQNIIEGGLIREFTGRKEVPGIYLQQMPYPCYKMKPIHSMSMQMLPLVLLLVWILFFTRTVKRIVIEKEILFKDILRIFGVTSAHHWIAFFLDSFFTGCLAAFLSSLVFTLIAGYFTVFFLFLLSFVIATIALAFLVSAFLMKASYCTILASIVYLGLYLFFTLISDVDSPVAKIFLCFISNGALTYGCKWLINMDSSGLALSTSAINYQPDAGSIITMLVIVIMLLIDAVIYILLAIYFENILSKQATKKPWNYCLKASYWKSCFKKYEPTADTSEPEVVQPQKNVDSKSFEAEPDGKIGIEVINISKEFGKSKNKIRVVNNLSINFYENQITSFLGHNGAGKSTTVLMMTGVLTPTKGTIRIYGVDLQKHPEQALKNIGICFQENILLGELSAKDHMILIGKLKRLSKKEIKRNMDELLEEFEFGIRAHQPVKHLSGGWKRKVCIAMAFMGGSRTIFLDEPTAGIDPFARRSIWDVLVRLKNGRTIVLITHHLDEADILGDRIAIIASGELKSCGSSSFLKNNLDKGYTLTIDTTVRGDKTFPSKSKGARKYISSQANELLGVVRSAIPGAEFEEERGCEFIFALPTKQSSSDLNRLFETIDKHKKRLNINSYGITAATLEEVFMKVLMKVEAEENNAEPGEASTSGAQHKDETKRNDSLDNREDMPPETDTEQVESNQQKRKSTLVADRKSNDMPREQGKSDSSLEISHKPQPRVSESEMKRLFYLAQKEKIRTARKFWNHMYALWIKRTQHSRRNFIFLLLQIFAPAAFMLFGLLSVLLASPNLPAVHVDVSSYDSSILFYTNSNPGHANLSSYEDALLGPYGLGTKCILSPGKCNLKSIEKGSMVANGKTIDSNKCTCKDGNLECEGNATAEPPEAQMTTGHTLFNLTGLNLNNWLIATEFKYSLKRIGGITLGHPSPLTGVSIGDFLSLFTSKSLSEVLEKYMADGLETIDPKEFTSAIMSGVNKSYGTELFKEKSSGNNIIVWFNSADKIASMAMMNGVTNMVLRASLPSGTDPSIYSVKLIVHPFEASAGKSSSSKLLETGVALGLVLLQSVCILMCMFIIYLVEERSCGMKQLAIISGVNPFFYWLTYFLWDILIFSVYIVLTILILLIFNISSLSGSNALPVFTACLFSYAVTALFFVYLLSNIFSVASNGVIFILVWVVLVGGIALLINITTSVGNSAKWVEVLNQILLLIPEFCLVKCVLNLSLGGRLEGSLTKTADYFTWDMSTKYIVRILCNGGAYLILLMVIEHRTVQPFGLITKLCSSLKMLNRDTPKNIEEDNDVSAEKHRVRSNKAKQDGDMFIVKDLTKIYCGQTRPAVDKACVGVKRGECLGLLGMNGAGKTTIFKMISGNATPTLGDATIGGLSITYKPMHSRLLIGYCPQTHALDPYLTPVEHLSFFSRIRGWDKKKRKKEVDLLIELLNLGKHKNKISKALSGGNKRKLNAAIALLNDPELVLLDEPTAGMDVLARRFLWNRLIEVLQDGRCLVLTTHSLEECQALATQVCIMSRGRFICFGPSQHLKNKFNEGYSLILRLVNTDKTKDVINYINENLQGSTVVRTHHLYMKIRLHPDIHIGKAVTALSELKRKQWIEDYSVNQTTLENVFLKLIGESNRESTAGGGCCRC